MPPEQWRGDWRDYGPWTDLYALGVMAWELVVGRIPFHGPMHEIMYAHLHRKLPRLRPRFDIPSGFEAWLHRMTAKAHAERFQRASDAAWHLDQLDPNTRHVVGTPLASLADLSGDA